MKARGTSAPVSWSRVARERRTALVPLAGVLVINLIILAAVVLPLARRVAANEARAGQSARVEQLAQAELRSAEALRDGKAQATQDLETFYDVVLPTNVAAARRVLNSRVMALAKEHDVAFESGSSDTEVTRGSNLERLVFTLTLTGAYDDIRAMIHDIETAPEFIVIDNIVLTEARNRDELSWALALSTYYRGAAARTGSDGS